jgi:hypothetical protein
MNGTLASVLNAVESADTAPTAQASALFAQTENSLQQLLAAWQKIQQQDLPALNRLARGAGAAEVTVPTAR